MPAGVDPYYLASDGRCLQECCDDFGDVVNGRFLLERSFGGNIAVPDGRRNLRRSHGWTGCDCIDAHTEGSDFGSEASRHEVDGCFGGQIG